MKNLKYFPFVRNRYFYGKLLTVDDFEVEQKYGNDKRRMLNRFLYGSGVVCGMNVVRVDDTTISVEMGMALDFSGREIVVDVPMIKKLSMIEGFDSDLEGQASGGFLYLCIEYAENEVEPVHSIASAGARAGDEVEHNKYAEGYRIFLTTQEPENEDFTMEHFYRDVKTVYWGNGIRIRQALPRYVRSGEEVEMRILVENMGQQQPFAFQYDLDLTCLQSEGEKQMTVRFNEKDFEKAARYEISYRLSAMAVKNTDGTAVLTPGSFKLVVGEKNVSGTEASCANRATITDRNAKRELMEHYYKTAMEEIVKNTFQQSIYLAKIRLIKAGSAYVIEEIENMPFRQFVYNNSLSQAINELQIDELERLKTADCGGKKGEISGGFRGEPSHTMASGTVTLDLGVGGTEGQKFFSEEITHGLGLGPVFILLGEAYTPSDDSERIFGNPEIFMESEASSIADVELGARTNVKDGTFTIGARVKKPTNARKLRVDWMAFRDSGESIHDVEVRKLMIKPELTDIEVRESCYFEAVCFNLPDRRVKWRVKEPEGGTINSNGMYTAPNVPGVYEIIAESLAQSGLTASTYVVVREKKQKKDKKKS